MYTRQMKTDTELTIPEIGPVLFASSAKAKRISISIRPPDRIRVAVPCGVSLSLARSAVVEKKSWIRKILLKFASMPAKQHERGFSSHENVPREAAEGLINRLDELARQHGFRYTRVTVRNQKTRWGSCSTANTISLNITLALLPEELRDYVLLHELVHTRHHHHQPEFWRELKAILPDALLLRKKLKGYVPGLR